MEQEKKKTFKIILFFLLAIILINIGFLIYYMTKPGGGGDDFVIALILFIILFSFISCIPIFLISYKISATIRKRNLSRKLNFETDLKEDFFQEYSNVRDIIFSSELTDNRKKEITNDVLEMMLTAQNSGKEIKDVVKDSRKFALEILESYDNRNWLLFFILDGLFFADIIVVALFLLKGFLFSMIDGFPDGFLRIYFDLYILANYLYWGFIMIPLLRFGKTNKKTPMSLWILIASYVGFFLLDIISFFVPGFKSLNNFFKQKIYIIPNIYVLLIYILIIPMAILLKKTIRNKTKIKLMSGDY
jgi:DNA-binding ferritin-like protein (Dps family)